MIYETLESAFTSESGLNVALHDALTELSRSATQSGQVAVASTLNGLAFQAGSFATIAGNDAAAARVQPNLLAAIAFGQGRIAIRLPAVVAMSNTFGTIPPAALPSGDRDRCASLFDRLVSLLRQTKQDLEESGTTPQGPAVNLARVRSTVDDLASYPVLTSETGGGGALSGGASAFGGGSGTATAVGVQRTVDTAIRQVLGRLPKYTDATAFAAALGATFELRAEQGHTVAVWQPRGFIGQTELGGSVTGAQASLYARASDALSAVIPVLHGLTPLRPDADVQEVDAARSVVESEFRAVVAELGTPGGARGARVDGLFRLLLSDTVIGIDNAPVQNGMLGYLGEVLGLTQGQVNTIEEEQIFSNYLLLRDYIDSIRVSWQAFNSTFAGRDLGTRLVLLSNALQVVAESVDEVTAAMDSVFVGSAERTVARFSTGSSTTMLVSELLAWVSTFASQEAPEIVQTAGRRGMGAVLSTGSQLIDLVAQLSSAVASDPGLPAGMRHPRVRHPLEELRTYLGQVVQLAADVRTVPNTP